MKGYWDKSRKVTIQLTDESASLATIIKWVQSIVKYPRLSVYDAKTFAEILKAGGVWHPELDTLHLPNPLFGHYEFHEQMGICKVDVVIEESDFEKGRKIQQGYWDLCKRGAEGDAEAAIAFCKAEMEGKVSHAAMG